MDSRPTLFLILISILIPSTLSEIKNADIKYDPRPHMVFESFGFSTNGAANVVVKSVSWGASQTPQLSALGFYLIPTSQLPDDDDTYCASFSNASLPILLFQDLHDSTANKTVHISVPDEYTLFFSNCLSNSTNVTMKVHTEMYNIGRQGEKIYLGVGQTLLPLAFFVFFMLYCISLGLWVFVCYKQKATVEKIHMLMGALLFFKAMTNVCAAEDQWHVLKTGMHHGWDVAFYLFGLFKGVLLFTVVVLIGAGWSLFKPCLQEKEKILLKVVITLQVIVNIVRAILAEEGLWLDNWLTWIAWTNFTLTIVDAACLAAVLFPTMWSVFRLSDASKSDGKASINRKKRSLFNKFYAAINVYYLINALVASGVLELASYKHFWLIIVIGEGAGLFFCGFMYYSFRPIEKNPYLYVGDEEEEEAAKALRSDTVG